MFPVDMVCLRNISVDTLHTGDTEDDDDDDNNNNNNNNNNTGHTNLTGPNSDFLPICAKFQTRKSQNCINGIHIQTYIIYIYEIKSAKFLRLKPAQQKWANERYLCTVLLPKEQT